MSNITYTKCILVEMFRDSGITTALFDPRAKSGSERIVDIAENFRSVGVLSVKTKGRPIAFGNARTQVFLSYNFV